MQVAFWCDIKTGQNALWRVLRNSGAMQNDGQYMAGDLIPTQVDTYSESVDPEGAPGASSQSHFEPDLGAVENSDLEFSFAAKKHTEVAENAPLAELLRPRSLKDYIGQSHLINDENGSIKNYVRLGSLPSMILYGPPGVGKTTLAWILARETNYIFVELSATDSTVADMKDILTQISVENNRRRTSGEDYLQVVVFIDEIHRFSKTQQDFLLPFIESGHFVFIGATTVNPKARIRRAILSRCQIFNLRALSELELSIVLRRAVLYNNIRRRLVYGVKFLDFSDSLLKLIASKSKGDSRAAIGVIELISGSFLNQTDGNLRYSNGDHEPLKLTESMVKPILESSIRIQGNRLQLKDERNLNLLLKLFDTMRNVERKRDMEFVELAELTDLVGTSKDSKENLSDQLLLNQKDKVERDGVVTKPPRRKYNSSKRAVDFSLLWAKMTKEELDEKIGNSDDSDFEQNYELSDDSSDDMRDEADIFLRTLYEEQTVYLAKFYLNAIIERGESPSFIVKQLILFTCLYTDCKAITLPEAVSMIKTLKSSSSNPKKLLSNFVERTTRARKRTITSEVYDPVRRLKKMKAFCKSHNSNQFEVDYVDEPIPVVFDEKLASQLIESIPPTTSILSVDENQVQDFLFPVEKYDVKQHGFLLGPD